MITRRAFLRSTGALTALVAAGPAAGALPRAARGRTLVLVFLRGGTDGLNLVVPHGDEHYYGLREWIAQRRPGQPGGVLDLDGFFGLHARASALHPLFQDGTAVALHAVGHGRNTRSHFEEQDVWETGLDRDTLGADGWLNRHLAATGGRGPVRAVAIGDGLPRVLRGEAEAVAVRDLGQLGLAREGYDPALTVAALRRAYGSGELPPLVEEGGLRTLEAMKELAAVAKTDYVPRVEYPDTDLGRRAREVARLIHADVGLEVAELDVGGWDTHRGQGAGPDGPYGALVQQTGDALAALARDLGDRLADVMILCVSEFGRTARQNGTGGTDHGWGNCVLALGGPVAEKSAGKARGVLGEWPGLGPDELQNGRDLRHTTDFRDVFAEVVRVHLGNPDVERVLPGHAAREVGLI